MGKKVINQLTSINGDCVPFNLSDLGCLRDRMDQLVDGVKFPEQISRERGEIEYVPFEWYRLDIAPVEKVVLYLHGGAYVMGSIKSHSALVAEMVKSSGYNFISVGYRLAPENPFPNALYDVLTVFRYLLSEGFKPENIAISGDSAGGGLALAAMISLRDEGYPQPAFGILISPWLDLTMSGLSIEENAAFEPGIDREAMGLMASVYLCGESANNKLASPLFADLNGLSPLLIQVGSDERLLDDSLRLEARTKGFDLDVTFEQWQGMVHGWHLSFLSLAEGKSAIDHIGRYMRDKWQ